MTTTKPFLFRESNAPRIDGAALFAAVILSGIWCVALWLLRAWRTDSGQYFYFVYNLALAAIPLFLSIIAVQIKNRRLFFAVGFVWLLFFPNAPYLLTDLIHLRPRGDAPFWFDWVMMISFAGSGFLIGCYSLFIMHRRFIQWWGKGRAWFCAIGILCLSSFGIYLGRFPRWNSWDIATRPLELFADIFTRFATPHEYPVLYIYTPCLAVVLVVGYVAIASGWLRD